VRIFLTIIITATVLILYAMFEKRVAQRACFHCDAKISIDDPEQKCPTCGAFAE
jgi:Zn finger protein HypA/HybF involved in hydrogenase expression